MIWEIWKISTKALESLKIGILMGFFNAKLKNYELKTHRGVICDDQEKWRNIWRGIDLSFQSSQKKFDEFWPEHLEVFKIFILICSFWANYILFQLKKITEELFYMKLNRDIKFGEDSTCPFKIDRRNLTNFDLSSRKFKTFHFNKLLLSKVYVVWAKKVQRSYLSWN